MIGLQNDESLPAGRHGRQGLRRNRRSSELPKFVSKNRQQHNK